MSFRFPILAFGFMSALGACGTGPDQNQPDQNDPAGPPVPPQITIRGVVLDTAGQGIPGQLISITFPGSTPDQPPAHATTDAQGLFVTTEAITDSTSLPAIRFVLITEDCIGLRDTILSQALGRRPSTAHDTVAITVALEGTGWVQLGVGRSCAWMARGVQSQESWLHLEIDSISDSIRGQWETYFRTATSIEPGSFSGSQRGDSLFFHLRSPSCISGYQFEATVLSDGNIGQGRLISNTSDRTCWPLFTGEFQLVQRDVQPWRP